jgi:hypothetical protein
MPVKFRCTKCERKFVEWGVAKVKSGEACEDCHGEYLEPIGYDATQAAPRKKPALKRKRARAPVATEVPSLASYDDETVAPDLDTLTTPASGTDVDAVEDFEEVEATSSDAGEAAEEEEAPEAAVLDDDVAEEPAGPVKDDEEE